MGDIVKWSIVLIGAVIFTLNLFTLARRRMTPMLSVIWSIFAVLLLVFGSVLHLSVLDRYMSPASAAVLIMAICAVVFAFYHISTQISDLVDKTHELTMQVSLLNSENVRLICRVRELEQEKDKNGSAKDTGNGNADDGAGEDS